MRAEPKKGNQPRRQEQQNAEEKPPEDWYPGEAARLLIEKLMPMGGPMAPDFIREEEETQH